MYKYTIRVVTSERYQAIFSEDTFEGVKRHLEARTYPGATRALVWLVNDVCGVDRVKDGAKPVAEFVPKKNGTGWRKV